MKKKKFKKPLPKTNKASNKNKKIKKHEEVKKTWLDEEEELKEDGLEEQEKPKAPLSVDEEGSEWIEKESEEDDDEELARIDDDEELFEADDKDNY